MSNYIPIQITTMRRKDRIRIKVVHKIEPNVNGWVDLVRSGDIFMIFPEAGSGEIRAFNAVANAIREIARQPNRFMGG